MWGLQVLLTSPRWHHPLQLVSIRYHLRTICGTQWVFHRLLRISNENHLTPRECLFLGSEPALAPNWTRTRTQASLLHISNEWWAPNTIQMVYHQTSLKKKKNRDSHTRTAKIRQDIHTKKHFQWPNFGRLGPVGKTHNMNKTIFLL